MSCFDLLRFAPPEDGLPVTEDWVSTFESMLFGGVELGREPLDVSLQLPPGLGCVKKHAFLSMVSNSFHWTFWTTVAAGQSLPLDCHCMDQIKGWTRSSVVMTILVAASELDLSDEKAPELLSPLFGVLDKCWMVPVQVTSLHWVGAVFHMAVSVVFGIALD